MAGADLPSAQPGRATRIGLTAEAADDAEAADTTDAADADAADAADAAEVVDLTERDSALRSDQLAQLIALGRERGFVTTREVGRAVASAPVEVSAAKLFARQARRAGIVIVDDQRGDTAARERQGDGGADAGVVSTADPVRLYLNEIGRVELLTPEEEVDLAKRVDAALAASAVLDSLVHLAPEQRGRLRLIERAGARAKQRLIEANLRLVVSIAKRYVSRGMALPDLIQEGNLGLMRAVDKFDFTRGYKFSTYATWWIRQMISRSIADQSRTIRIPMHLVETLQRVRRAERHLVQTLGREPTDEEVAAATELPVGRLEELRRLATDPASLDAPIGDDGDAVMGELLEDANATVPADAASQSLLREHLHAILDELNPRERAVIERRFGLLDANPHTLDQVGGDLGLTRERIRQIEAKALAKLRHPAYAEALEGYLQD